MSSMAIDSSRFSRASSSRICAWMVTSSAVVGSSAISSFGSLARAAAIITRWRCPPDSWCGKAASRASASGKPARVSNSTTRAWSAAPASGWCRVTASLTWRPMLCSGLSEVIGSWKTIPATPPRRRCNSRSGACRTSMPSSVMEPAGLDPAAGSNCRQDSAMTDLPDPLSPTSATVSPVSTWKDTPSTTRLAPKATARSRTSSNAI